ALVAIEFPPRAPIPSLIHLFARGERYSHVDREDRLAVAAHHDVGSKAAMFGNGFESLDAVIEDVRAPVGLIEEPAEVAAAGFIERGEKIPRLWMLETPALEVDGHGVLQRRPAEVAFERIQPQRSLRVGHRVARGSRRE